jgi:hypothetical protein
MALQSKWKRDTRDINSIGKYPQLLLFRNLMLTFPNLTYDLARFARHAFDSLGHMSRLLYRLGGNGLQSRFLQHSA